MTSNSLNVIGPLNEMLNRHMANQGTTFEEIVRVRRKDVGVSGESVSVSWNAGLTQLVTDD